MRILLIEDDKDLCGNIKLALDAAGYETECCHDGSDGLFYAKNGTFDVIVLDRMLPGVDGLTVLMSLRRQGIQTPVILATALDGLDERIGGLDAGADDYLVKPFAVEELMARIRAVTRRPGRMQSLNRLTAFGLSLEPENRTLSCGQQTVSLSRRESALLECFLKNPGRTLTRARILSYVWGATAEVEDGNLDNYIYFLRRRLASINAPVKLTTVHGTGYMLEEMPPEPETDPEREGETR